MENLYLEQSASIAYDRSNTNFLSLNWYYKQKEQIPKTEKSCIFALFMYI